MRTARLLLASLLLLAAACRSMPHYPGTPEIDALGFRPAAPGVATCGQPDASDLEEAAAAGYRTVVNFRDLSEPGALPDEETRAAGLGLRYVYVPVTPRTLSWSHADRLAAVLATPDAAPVLLHCSTGGRAAAVYALWQAKYAGVPAADALSTAESAGLKPEARDALVRVLSER
jgi:uncharacterized protein (TIGR01244 family)